MKEKQPLPEEPKEKLQSKCWNCEHTVRSSLANTLTVIYTKQSYFNHTQLSCLDKDCGAVTVLFHDLIGDKGVAIAVQYPSSIYEYCDDDTITSIRKKAVNAIDLIPRQLSNRAEEQIAHWGAFLQRVVVDETDFGVGNES